MSEKGSTVEFLGSVLEGKADVTEERECRRIQEGVLYFSLTHGRTCTSTGEACKQTREILGKIHFRLCTAPYLLQQKKIKGKKKTNAY